mgnify:FL=1
MNKKGFTLIEIIVVLALLGAIMLLVVPNITKNFKESKKRLFYDNVLGIYSSASRTYFSQDNASNKSFSNTGVKLDVDLSDDITYRVKVDSYGVVLSIYVTDGTYTYKLDNANGISKKDIKLANVIEGKVDGYLTLYEQLFKDNPTISTRTDFSTPFTTNTVNTLYKSTENGTDVYYFAGQDTESTPINNWVKFGKNSSNQDLYWRIIRTNADGSIKLLYSGTSPDTTTGYIGFSRFRTNYNNSKYVGYMYGDRDATLEEARTNTNNSTIKTYIDNWYASNMTSYTKYLSPTAVYCNDREVGSGTYSAAGSAFYYAAYTRLATNKTPTYDCTNNNDKFTVDASSGNGKLTYPIALMTADEIAYAGGRTGQETPMWYYTNSSLESSTGTISWWSLSPNLWNGAARSWFVFGSGRPGDFGDGHVDDSRGVRPAVSLKSCVKYSTGNGTSETPYEIVETSSGC